MKKVVFMLVFLCMISIGFSAEWDYTGTNYSISDVEIQPQGIHWDGTNWWVVGSTLDTVLKYNST